jgi:membrane protease YdiL (CAAX protease family)
MTASAAKPALPMPVLQAGVVLLLGVVAWRVDLFAGIAGIALLAGVWPPAVPWRPLAARATLARYFPFAAAWLVFLIVYLQAAAALGQPVAPQQLLEAMAREGTAMPDLLGHVVAIVAVAPLFEEIVFRGYLFSALDQLVPRWLVHALTAAAFGLVHGLAYALPIGVLALLFGWLRARHRALLPSVLAHGLHNALTVAMTLCWPGHLDLLYPR